MYSVGSNYDFSFERAAATLGCHVHVFDPTMPQFSGSSEDEAQRAAFGITFHDVGLGAKSKKQSCDYTSCSFVGKPGRQRAFSGKFGCYCSWNLATLPGLMHRLGHHRLEVLKLDIEGVEWSVLEALLATKSGRRLLGGGAIRQLAFEIHLPREKPPERQFGVLQELEDLGYALWNRDENLGRANTLINWHGLHFKRYHELSYVHTGRAARGESEPAVD